MKKTMLFSSALVALAMLASCQKEEFIETPATATGVTEFTATIESTKTTIASDGKVNWEQGDEITVTDAESKSAVYVAASSASSTTFTLKQGQTAVGAGPYTATYGDITKQVYDANGANCPLSAGKTTGTSTNLQFSSPYAVLKITAKSSGGETIKTVVVKYGNSSSVLDCEGQNVTLTSDGVAFYVAVQPSTEAAALSVTFYNTANKMAKKTRNGSILLDANDLLPVTLGSFEWTDLKTFKAMYKETDGSLTFYYDTQNHSGEGITVYENGTENFLFDDTKSNPAKWGYNGNRSKIKSVVIDGSVKDYPFLTSTVYMFQGMTIATNISGAEYLDVSNVTNMTGMFWNFGGGSANSHTTLNSVPDVSKWNTANVTNMAGMFNSYGQYSDNLTIVPDVSNWNTANVTNMSSMFQYYGYSSTGFNARPDVGNWNTASVKDMSTMFRYYGQNSTALTAVPDVCNWNTAEVKTMAEMFRQYGASSTVLKAVPDVSGWETTSLTNMGYMFEHYGNGSVDFVLDLSGWDLSKITSNSGHEFDLNPNTFKVNIPAKTDGKSNDTGNWYYGNGGNGGSIIPPTGKTFTPALAGVFSVSVTKKVHFSKGNLWYGPVTEGASATFNFEAEQYSISSSWDANHVSNFYWSKTASVAYADSYNESGTSASDVFFTNATETTAKTDFEVNGQKNVWRTLSHDEWKYLFENHLYNYVSVNGKYGIVIVPDGFSGTIADSYDATAWSTAESNGLVFLPNTGFRNNGTGIGETDKSCFYWTSTASGNTEYEGQPTAYRMFFQWNSSLDHRFDEPGLREWAIGIRLVTE